MQMSVLEQVFLILNSSGINYCVVSNTSTLPEYCESDIDLIYAGASERDISLLIKQIEDETGIVCLEKVTTGYEEYSFMFAIKKENSIEKIQLDFFKHLYHKEYGIILHGERILAKRRREKCFFVPDDIDELIYTVLRRAAKGRFETSHYQLIQKLYQRVDTHTIEIMRKQSPRLWTIIEKVAAGENVEKADLAKCVRQASCNTLGSRINILLYKTFKYYPRRLLHPLGLSIAFLAPDGAGKTTIINSILEDSFFSNFFFKIDVKYFRPRLLKNLGHYNSLNPREESKNNTDPHNVVLNGRIKSFIRFSFYNLDFLLGNALKIFPQKVKRNLVVFDRYYYDYFADMKRYQYNLPEWMPARFSCIIPKPDIVIILDAPAKVLYQRKQELTVEEIEEVSAKFRDNRRYYGNSHTINVNRPLDEIMNEIRLIVFDYLKDRVSRRGL